MIETRQSGGDANGCVKVNSIGFIMGTATISSEDALQKDGELFSL